MQNLQTSGDWQVYFGFENCKVVVECSSQGRGDRTGHEPRSECGMRNGGGGHGLLSDSWAVSEVESRVQVLGDAGGTAGWVKAGPELRVRRERHPGYKTGRGIEPWAERVPRNLAWLLLGPPLTGSADRSGEYWACRDRAPSWTWEDPFFSDPLELRNQRVFPCFDACYLLGRKDKVHWLRKRPWGVGADRRAFFVCFWVFFFFFTEWPLRLLYLSIKIFDLLDLFAFYL